MTDSKEIGAVAERHGVNTFYEETTTGKATLDEVAFKASERLRAQGSALDDILITVQPTCPFISTGTIKEAIEKLEAGADTVLSVVDDRHLNWVLDKQKRPRPAYKKRLNRQDLPELYRETGGVIGARLGKIIETRTRIHPKNVTLIELASQKEALDIDNYADFLLAEYYLSMRKVVLRADGAGSIGLGHVFRCLAIAVELPEHSVTIVTRCDGEFDLGAEIFKRSPYKIVTVKSQTEFLDYVETQKPFLIILDILDTSTSLISTLNAHSQHIVSFEDMGEGATLADIVVNDLYGSFSDRENILSGLEHAIIAPGFELVQPINGISETVTRILVVFGGTDPENLTIKALEALSHLNFSGECTVVLGYGKKDVEIDLADYGLHGQVLKDVEYMPEVMRRADLVLSSAGRTVTELISLGVPTLVLCQNKRELFHTHATMFYGVMNLGLGALIEPETLSKTLSILMSDWEMRDNMHRMMLNVSKKRSNKLVVDRIFSRLNNFKAR